MVPRAQTYCGCVGTHGNWLVPLPDVLGGTDFRQWPMCICDFAMIWKINFSEKFRRDIWGY